MKDKNQEIQQTPCSKYMKKSKPKERQNQNDENQRKRKILKVSRQKDIELIFVICGS